MSFRDQITLRECRRLLRNNPTPQEEILWKHLKCDTLGVRFRRQHSIGNYIVDFYCSQKRLVIEIDGGQHRKSVELDRSRDDYLRELDYKVLRFWNSEIDTDIQKVIKTIKNLLISC